MPGMIEPASAISKLGNWTRLTGDGSEISKLAICCA